MTKIDGRTNRKNLTHEKILKTTRFLIDKTDKPPLMREVSKRSNVALRTVYHHFPNANLLIRRALALEPARQLVVIIEPWGKKVGSQ